MNIDWTTVIVTALPLILSVGMIEVFIFRKQNQRLKDLEVDKGKQDIKTDNIELQKQEIDLGSKFMEQSMEMMRQVQDAVIGGNKDVRNDLSEIKNQVTVIDGRVALIEEYLNGDYKKFLKNKDIK